MILIKALIEHSLFTSLSFSPLGHYLAVSMNHTEGEEYEGCISWYNLQESILDLKKQELFKQKLSTTINIATFHPEIGNGFFYGTGTGNVILIQ